MSGPANKSSEQQLSETDLDAIVGGAGRENERRETQHESHQQQSHHEQTHYQQSHHGQTHHHASQQTHQGTTVADVLKETPPPSFGSLIAE